MAELRLRTFGGVQVDGPAGAAATQRRRLAFLALLAASDTGVTREALIGFLWPDTNEERAKHALAQLLYSVRREFGDDVVQADAVALRLNTTVLPADVAEFRTAIADGDLERVAGLHSGPFLQGFYLTGCPAFERWVEESRTAFAESARGALDRLASKALGDGEAGDAVDWARRLIRLAPLDGRGALLLMRSLAAAGDRAGALDVARVHEALVRSELEAPVDPAIMALVGQLRSPAPPAPVMEGSEPPVAPPADEETVTTSAPAERAARDTVRPVAAPGRRWRMGAAYFLGVATLAVLGTMLTRRATSDQPRRWVLIADAENATGEGALDRTIPVALAAALAQSRGIYPVPPDRVREALVRMRRPGADSVLGLQLAREIAQREGIHAVAVPVAERSGSGFELSVKIIDPETGGVTAMPVVRADQRAGVIVALDELSRKVRRSLGESRLAVARNTTPLPLVTTSSLDALRKYADGGAAFARSRYREATALWQDAVRLDSTFASAYASLGQLAYYLNSPVEGATYFSKALRHVGALPEREQVRIRALAESERGNHVGAIQLLEPRVAADSGDLGLLQQLANSYMRAQKSRDAERAFRRIIALDSLRFSARINLATVLKPQGRNDEALDVYRAAYAIYPSELFANNSIVAEFGATYVAVGELDSARVLFTRLLAAETSVRARALRSLAYLDLRAGQYAAAKAHLGESTSLYSAQKSLTSEVRNHVLLAQAYEAVGHSTQAGRELDSAATLATIGRTPPPALLLFVGKPLARHGSIQRATRLLQLAETIAQRDVSADVAAVETLRGELLLARDRPKDALPHLRAGLHGDPPAYHIESYARGLAAAGLLDSAVVQYAALEPMAIFGHEAQTYVQAAPYWLGRLQEQRGDMRGAAAAYGRYLASMQRSDAGAVMVADARLRLARVEGTR